MHRVNESESIALSLRFRTFIFFLLQHEGSTVWIIFHFLIALPSAVVAATTEYQIHAYSLNENVLTFTFSHLSEHFLTPAQLKVSLMFFSERASASERKSECAETRKNNL